MRIAALITAVFLLMLSTTYAQLPELTSSDKQSPIKLQKLDIHVKIIGTRAETVFTMTFKNAYAKVLEGTLLLPLPEGASVTRYALDINGKMREGVPVEKEKATEVFEAVEKRRIDPGLLEKTEGNVFRTRIYPMPANGVRTVTIAYEQELRFLQSKELSYHLPLHSKDTIQSFSINVDVQEKDNVPTLISSPVGNLKFLFGKGHYCAQEMRSEFLIKEPLQITISKKSKDVEGFVQRKNGAYYFYLHTFLNADRRERVLPKSIVVVWDNSLSGLYRNRTKEMELLQAYLKRIKNATVKLYTISNTFQSLGSFEVKDGRFKELTSTIQELVYDGGTNFSQIRFEDADETLLFSDGISTLSFAGEVNASGILHAVSASSKTNYAALKRITAQNGGAFINLSTLTINDALKELISQPLRFLGIKKNDNIVEHYPSQPVMVQNGFSMAGQIDEATTDVTLLFGYGKEVAFEKNIYLSYDEYGAEEWDFAKLFAQKKIEELELDQETNKEQILALGKQYSIVTQNTSLLVLEDVRDYVRHKIEPPLELRAAYKELIKEQSDDIFQRRQQTLDNALGYSKQLWEWWNTTYPKKSEGVSRSRNTTFSDSAVAVTENMASRPPPPPPPMQEGQQDQRIAQANIDIVKDEEVTVHKSITGSVTIINQEAISGQALQGRAAGLQVQEVVVVGYGKRLNNAVINTANDGQLILVDGQIASSLPPKQAIKRIETIEPKAGVALYGAQAINGVVLVTTINAKVDDPENKLEEKQSTASYMKVLSKTPQQQQYITYLQLRDKNLLNPNFYYDVATFFLKSNRELGLKILTNLGELDFHNHELHKLFGFKLKELGESELQCYVFKQVLSWRPMEPQSHRDYAMSLSDMGKHQEALDMLYLALTKDYGPEVIDKYSGIEETIVTEINYLVQKHKSMLNLSAIDHRLLHAMPVDVRVVLNWNMNDTDIDLWVTDPDGEKCLYSNRETNNGGRMSEDFTNGYGPEQFLLKKAKHGKYKIQVHYYGERGVKVAGKTTLLMEVYTNFGKETEQLKLITLQLEGEERDGIYVGDFFF